MKERNRGHSTHIRICSTLGVSGKFSLRSAISMERNRGGNYALITGQGRL